MHNYKYTITNLILDYIVKYELSVREINSKPLTAEIKEQLYDKLKAEDLQALSELIGVPLGFTQALNIQRGKEAISSKSQNKIFSNYRSLQDFVNFYNGSNFVTPSTDLVIHVNKLVTSGVFDEWETGKIKTFSERPNELYDTWYKLRDYYPELDITNHFNNFFSTIYSNKIKIHKLLLIPIFMFEMIDKAPMFSCNQITTIGMVSILLKLFNYNPENYLTVAKAFNYISGDMLEAYKMTGNKKDLTYFMEAILYSLSLEMRGIESQVQSLYMNKVKKYNVLQAELNPRQIKILEYLENIPKIDRKTATKMMGVSFMTAFRDIQFMIEKNYLESKGTGRGTYYKIKNISKPETKSKSLDIISE